jgi:DNA-binding CsgD family transcriptional regulator
MLDIDNPFTDYGRIVHGPRFIGRQAQLREIESRIIHSPGGNLAIIGQRRVGKSSLAYQAVMTRCNELVQRRILPLYVSVASLDTSQRFFCDLVGICFRQLEDLGLAVGAAGRRIRELAEEIRARDSARFSFIEIGFFFDETHAAGIRIIFVLDEFDKTARFFAGDSSFFDRLREISYRGHTTLLTISRDPIPTIEQKSNITSTLMGTFHEQYLGMFEESEIEDHFDRLTKVGLDLTDADRHQIIAHCGGNPYLHDKIAFELVELFRQDGQVRLEEAFRHSERAFRSGFDSIIEHLRARGLLETLMQVLFVSPTRLKSAELNELESYGLIRPAGSGYMAFSTFFQEYLQQAMPVLLQQLTETERRVVKYLKGEKVYKEIADKLNMGEETIRTHIRHIFRKLGVNSREDAVRRASELGILE